MMYSILILVTVILTFHKSSDSFNLMRSMRMSTTGGNHLPSTSTSSMKSKISRSLSAISLGVALQFTSNVISPSPVFADAIPVVGTAAPTFSLPSNAGKELSLADLSGKRTVLYFYPGDFTQSCTIEAQGFQRDIQQYNDLGVQIVGVSVDSTDKHLDFKKKYGLDFTLLSDKGGAVSNKYGSLLDLGFIGKFSNRQTYIISPQGQIEYVFTDVESNVAKHSEAVLKVLKSLP